MNLKLAPVRPRTQHRPPRVGEDRNYDMLIAHLIEVSASGRRPRRPRIATPSPGWTRRKIRPLAAAVRGGRGSQHLRRDGRGARSGRWRPPSAAAEDRNWINFANVTIEEGWRPAVRGGRGSQRSGHADHQSRHKEVVTVRGRLRIADRLVPGTVATAAFGLPGLVPSTATLARSAVSAPGAIRTPRSGGRSIRTCGRRAVRSSRSTRSLARTA